MRLFWKENLTLCCGCVRTGGRNKKLRNSGGVHVQYRDFLFVVVFSCFPSLFRHWKRKESRGKKRFSPSSVMKIHGLGGLRRHEPLKRLRGPWL